MSTSVSDGHAWQVTHVHGLQHVHGISVDFNRISLQRRLVRDKIHSTLSFLFLKFQRDASDWASLDSLHQVGGKTCDFVSQSLGRDDGDFIRDSLVRGEIES